MTYLTWVITTFIEFQFPSSLSLIKHDIWVQKLIEFSSFEYLFGLENSEH